jgi:hydrogenase maturation factor
LSVEPDRCVTCSDAAVAARVRAVEGLAAVVDVDGRVERVAIDLVADAHPGDLLLCHAGIALERLGEGGP